MAANYVFTKRRDVNPQLLYEDIARFFLHIASLGVDLQGFELKPDGTVTVRLDKAIQPDALDHLGLGA